MHLKPVISLELEFGTVNIYPPAEAPTEADEEHLYRVLLECLLVKGQPEGSGGGDLAPVPAGGGP